MTAGPNAMGTQEKKGSAFCDDYMLLSSALCRYSELCASGQVREPFEVASSLIQFLAFTVRQQYNISVRAESIIDYANYAISLVNHTDAQVHVMRWKRRTPTNPSRKETTSSNFGRNASITSTVQDKTGRDEERTRWKLLEGCRMLLLVEPENPNSAPFNSSSLFLPNVIESFAAVHLILSTSSINDLSHHRLFTIPVCS